MAVKKRFLLNLSTICLVTIPLSIPFSSGPASASAATEKILAAGTAWDVNETTSLTSLTVGKDAVIKASEGRSITMTVDGVETTIKAGNYKGNIKLTITKEIKVQFQNLEPHLFRTAVYIENGKYISDKSVASAVTGGKITDTSATDAKITSAGEKFNAIMVTGDTKSSYSIVNPSINFTGNGGNDFAGFGAAIMSSGKADVTVQKANIITHGAVRTAVFVGGDSTMHVNDSYIEVHNGVLPADYEFTIQAGKMKEVPWMLGLTGNCRATNVVDNGTAYYNNTHIKAQGWGALSTDGPIKIRLYATKCLIETVESGYGAYSILDTIDTFSNCTFKVHDVGLIIAMSGSAVFTDGTIVNSGRFGVMMHGVVGGGKLTIEKGCVFNTKSTVIQVKGRGTNIVVDNAKLNPENGIILQAMESDDPYAGGGAGLPGGVEGGMPAMPVSGDAEKGMPPMPASEGRSGGPSGSAPPGGGAAGNDVTALFKNVTLNGDIVNSMTAKGEVIVTFEKTAITGAITTAAAAAVGKPSKENYRLIGKIKNTYHATDDKKGVMVSLDGKSTWTVDKTSYLNGLTVSEGAVINAPKGFKVLMTVDGILKEIKAGAYKGRIVLSVTKS
jgi:hypothetical protein